MTAYLDHIDRINPRVNAIVALQDRAALLVTMCGCPALAALAGFSPEGLPTGIQIIAPNRRELDCLQLTYAYESATHWSSAHLPALLA